MPSVGIIGAGVAGLSAAHELLERGFDVTVYEASDHAGGKAGSVRTAEGWVREHVNKNFSAHYYCLFETLKRIPCSDGGSVMDRLQPALRSTCRFPDGSQVSISGKMGMTRPERSAEGRRFIAALSEQGLPKSETLDFIAKHARLLTMCEARRERELGHISYSEYLGVEQKSPAFRHLMHLIEISAAANPEGPARAAAEQTLRIFGRMYNPHGLPSMINTLDGPSHERFIEPWVAHIESLGGRLRFGCPVGRIDSNGERPSLHGDGGLCAEHDAVVVATPTGAWRTLLPSLALPASCEKRAHGFYFRLSGAPEGVEEGELRFALGSPWAVISGFRRFEGTWYMWVAASNANTPGALHGRCFPDCTEADLREELLAQTAFAQPELVEGFFTGHGLEWSGTHWHTEAPLFAATLGVSEVSNETPLPRVYVAGEATRTTIKVATMEKANESAKRCAAAICAAHGVDYPADKFTYDPFPGPALRRADARLERLRRTRSTAPKGLSKAPDPEPSSKAESFVVQAGEHEAHGRHYGSASARVCVVIQGAIGTPQDRYTALADNLAQQGFAAVTYDYSGMETSAGHARGSRRGPERWGREDQSAIFRWARERHPRAALVLLGHSMGGQLLGYHPRLAELDGVVLVSAQSTYVGHWKQPLMRLQVRAIWSVAFPATARMLGYLPGRFYGGQDLPATAVRDGVRWAHAERHVLEDAGVIGNLRELRAPVKAYIVSDDTFFAPRAAVEALLESLPNAPVSIEELHPEDAGLSRIGHFGFFSPRAHKLWTRLHAHLRTLEPRRSEPPVAHA